MKITYSDEGAYARIWLNGPFWQYRAAMRLANAGMLSTPVYLWVSRGLTFQITLYGKSAHILRAYKAIVAEESRLTA
ncbi:TPA: hypothetical protein ACQVH3_005239 [Serratia marcescens]